MTQIICFQFVFNLQFSILALSFWLGLLFLIVYFFLPQISVNSHCKINEKKAPHSSSLAYWLTVAVGGSEAAIWTAAIIYFHLSFRTISSRFPNILACVIGFLASLTGLCCRAQPAFKFSRVRPPKGNTPEILKHNFLCPFSFSPSNYSVTDLCFYSFSSSGAGLGL